MESLFLQAAHGPLIQFQPGLAIDAHWTWQTVEDAAAVLRRLDQFDLDWVEDPLWPEAVVAYRDPPMLPEEIRSLVFWEVLVFLATLVVAYVYAWRKGVFQWR